MTKSVNNTQVQTATAENPNGKTKTVTTTYSGAANPNYISIGGGPKWRMYQNKWFTVTGGIAALFTIASSPSYDTGTHTVTTPNTDSPDTYTNTDTAKGTTKLETSPSISIGPRIGATAFLPFFPNLAIGFNAGILGTFGGGTKSTVATTTSSQTVTSGTAGTTVITSQATTVTEVSPGMAGATTAIGGTGLGFGGSGLIPFTVTGTFTISYCW